MRFRNLFFVLIFFSSLGKLIASDYYGGSIYYKSIGNNQYQVTAKLIAGCSISNFDTAFITASDSNGAFKIDIATLVSETDITGYGSKAGISRCYSSPLIHGFVERTYVDTFDLTGKGCEIYFSLIKYSRVSFISTNNLGSNSMYLRAYLNQCDGNGNSSPEFIAAPKILIDANSKYHQNWGVFEPNSNSEYVIELDTPKATSSSNPSYFGNYSALKPFRFLGWPNNNLPSPSGFHFDNETGDLQATPNLANEVSVVKVKASEYQTINGARKLIGFVERDLVQINISDTNHTPTLNLQDEYFVCIGDTLRMYITAFDSNTKDSLSMAYYPVLQGNVSVNFMNTNNRRPAAFFSYVPTSNDFNKLRYFVFSVADTSLSGSGNGKSNVYTSKIRVVKKPEFTFGVQLGSCNEVYYTVNNITDSADIGMKPAGEIKVYNSFGNQVLKSTTSPFLLNNAGSYRIEYTAFGRGCNSKKDTIIYVSNSAPSLGRMDTSFCRNSEYELKPKVNYFNLQNCSFKWITGNPADTLSSLVIYDSLVSDTGSYLLQIQDNNNQCVYNLEYNYIINNIPQATISGQNEFCPYDTAKYLVLHVDSFKNTESYLWLNFNYPAPSMTVIRPKRDTTVYLKVTNKISGCSDTFSIPYVIFPLTSMQMTADTLICGGNSVDLKVKANGIDSCGIIGYGAAVSDSFTIRVAPSNGINKYYGFILDSNSCFNFDSTEVSVGGPQINIPNDTGICRGDTLQLIGSANNASVATWTNLLGQDIDTIYHIAGQSPFNIYYYSAIDSLGCNTRDSIRILNYFTKAQVGVSANYCVIVQFDTLGFHYPYGGTLAGSGFSNDTFFPATAGVGYHKYTYTYTDVNSCQFVYEDSVRVWDIPNPDFTMSPDTGRAPLLVSFFNTSSNARDYLWIFGGKDTSYDENPTYTFNDTGFIEVILFASNPGCGFDTTIKTVEVRPAVLSNFQELDNHYKIYPNPSNQYINVEIDNDFIKEIRCLDISGKTILHQKNINEKQVKLDLSKLSASMYLLEIVDSNSKIMVYKIQILR